MVTVSARSKKALLAGGLVLGILLLGLLCFYKLGVGELCDWDEARHAVLPIHFFGVILHTNSLLYLLAIGLLILSGGWYWLRHEGTSRPTFFDSDLFLSVLAVTVPFLIFSAAKTKIDWYILPLYPALVLWASISLHYVLQNKSLRFGTALAALAFVVCIGVSVKNVKEIAFDVTSSPSAVSQLLTPVGSLDKAHTYIANHVGSSWDGSGWNGTEWRQVQLAEAEWLTDCTPAAGRDRRL